MLGIAIVLSGPRKGSFVTGLGLWCSALKIQRHQKFCLIWSVQTDVLIERLRPTCMHLTQYFNYKVHPTAKCQSQEVNDRLRLHRKGNVIEVSTQNAGDLSLISSGSHRREMSTGDSCIRDATEHLCAVSKPSRLAAVSQPGYRTSQFCQSQQRPISIYTADWPSQNSFQPIKWPHHSLVVTQDYTPSYPFRASGVDMIL